MKTKSPDQKSKNGDRWLICSSGFKLVSIKNENVYRGTTESKGLGFKFCQELKFCHFSILSLSLSPQNDSVFDTFRPVDRVAQTTFNGWLGKSPNRWWLEYISAFEHHQRHFQQKSFWVQTFNHFSSGGFQIILMLVIPETFIKNLKTKHFSFQTRADVISFRQKRWGLTRIS